MLSSTVSSSETLRGRYAAKAPEVICRAVRQMRDGQKCRWCRWVQRDSCGRCSFIRLLNAATQSTGCVCQPRCQPSAVTGGGAAAVTAAIAVTGGAIAVTACVFTLPPLLLPLLLLLRPLQLHTNSLLQHPSHPPRDLCPSQVLTVRASSHHLFVGLSLEIHQFCIRTKQSTNTFSCFPSPHSYGVIAVGPR